MHSETTELRERNRGDRKGVRYSKFMRVFAELISVNFEDAKATTFAPNQCLDEVFTSQNVRANWSDLYCQLEDAFNGEMPDINFWDSLAFRRLNEAKPDFSHLTCYRLWLLVTELPMTQSESEESSIDQAYVELLCDEALEGLTRYIIADTVATFNWESLPDDHRLVLSDVQQLSLFLDLVSMLHELDFELKIEDFFVLFEERAPEVSELINLVEAA